MAVPCGTQHGASGPLNEPERLHAAAEIGTAGIGLRERPVKVLIVEDDADMREALQQILEREGHDVVLAADGREALDLLDAESGFSLVLVDLLMPVINGWQLIEAMKAEPALARIPVVAMTGAYKVSPLPTDLIVLKKPFAEEALLELVRSCGAP